MFTAKLRQYGKSYVVTVPRAEVERLGLVPGQLVHIEFHRVPGVKGLAPDLQKAFEKTWQASEAALRYLADR